VLTWHAFVGLRASVVEMNVGVIFQDAEGILAFLREAELDSILEKSQ
jgi:hypothetical protein